LQADQVANQLVYTDRQAEECDEGENV
jgi:hypothetical protein